MRLKILLFNRLSNIVRRSLFVCALLVGSMIAATTASAQINYIDENGTRRTYTGVITQYYSESYLRTGWYYVSGSISTNRIIIEGDVHIILTDM